MVIQYNATGVTLLWKQLSGFSRNYLSLGVVRLVTCKIFHSYECEMASENSKEDAP